MKKTTLKHILAIDAVAFHGGSKTASAALLNNLAAENIRVTVLTLTPKSWHIPQATIAKFREFSWLSKRECGVLYFLKHLFIATFVLYHRIKLGKNTVLLGTSGPGVDLSLYVVKCLTKTPIVQLIHGPVAPSRTIAKAMASATTISYLPSALASMTNALAKLANSEASPSTPNMLPMQVGIPLSAWPSPSVNTFKELHVYWAASLLRWKGLDTLSAALTLFTDQNRPTTTLCYIRPQNTALASSRVPQGMKQLRTYEQPANLDELRSHANVFVSTSHKEPFGLSILEAMAAGLCIVIPRDGAYWDQQLAENVHCLKYTPNCENDLYKTLKFLQEHMTLAKEMAEASKKLSECYRAENTFSPIVNAIRPLWKHEQTLALSP